MKNIIMVVVMIVTYAASGQTDLSDYKYIVIPKRFSDFKEENQHRTNTLVKYLYSDKGFVTVYTDNLPKEIYNNKCMGLYADLVDDSSMFTTKTILTLKDCDGKEVLRSQQGRSKKKGYEESYKEAITNAFNSFVGLKYAYQSKKTETPVTVSFKNDVKSVDQQSDSGQMIEQIATEETQSFKDRTPVASSYEKGTAIEKKIEGQKGVTTIPASAKENESRKLITSALSGVLYAQELSNGYQLVDSAPKIQLKMYKSSMPNVYVANGDGKDGVVYASDGKWFFEYFSEGSMVKEELNIKF